MQFRVVYSETAPLGQPGVVEADVVRRSADGQWWYLEHVHPASPRRMIQTGRLWADDVLQVVPLTTGQHQG